MAIQNSDTTQDLGAQIRDGVHQKADALAHLAKDAADSGKGLYDAGHVRMREEIDHLKASLSKLVDQAARQSEASVHAVSDAVVSRPLLSVCGAFAAGVVISLLMGGRRS